MNKRLKHLVNISGLSECELARRTGLSQQVISLYLFGKRRPRAAACVLIARELGCNAWDIDPDLLAVVPDGLQELAGTWNALSPRVRANLSRTIQETVRRARKTAAR